jgi:anti-sigma B factor antagonist
MSTVDFQHVKTNMVGDVAVVEVLSHELRFPPQCRELETELNLITGQDWAKKVLVNLARTKYLCSTGFGVLVNLVKKAKAEGREIKFSDLDPAVRIGADIIGLDKVAEIHDTEHEALKAFSSDDSAGPAFAT